MKIVRPHQLQDQLVFIQVYAPDRYRPRHQTTNALAFAEAFAGLEYFKGQTPTTEGKEAIQQCIRNLHVAFELYEHGDNIRASATVQETGEMFRKARKYIDTED